MRKDDKQAGIRGSSKRGEPGLTSLAFESFKVACDSEGLGLED